MVLLKNEKNVFINVNKKVDMDAFLKNLPDVKLDDDLEEVVFEELPTYNLHLFIHTSDYLSKSESHFQLFEEEKKISNFIDIVFGDDPEIKSFKEMFEDHFKTKILWYKHETASCTVYKELKPLKERCDGLGLSGKKRESEREAIEEAFLNLFNKHDIKERDTVRRKLMSFSEDQENAEKYDI